MQLDSIKLLQGYSMHIYAVEEPTRTRQKSRQYPSKSQTFLGYRHTLTVPSASFLHYTRPLVTERRRRRLRELGMFGRTDQNSSRHAFVQQLIYTTPEADVRGDIAHTRNNFILLGDLSREGLGKTASKGWLPMA